jgi:protein ImuB
MHLGYGVEAVRLTACWTETIPHDQLDAWGQHPGNDDRAFDELLDTVINRWGDDRVLVPRAVASHTPEVARQFQRVREADACSAVAPVDRPSILLDQPEPANAIALLPDAPPSYLEWRGEGCALSGGSGPERIVTEWWGFHRSSTRDYFKVQRVDGTWLWTFHELDSNRWFVHGIWA